MKKRQYPGVSSYRDRHGTLRWRYQKKGVRGEIGAHPYGSPGFIARYEEITKGRPKAERAGVGTFHGLVARYYASAGYLALGDSTKTTYSGWMESIRDSIGPRMVKDLRRADVLAMMGALADKPAAANNRLRALRVLMQHALDIEWRKDDPTLGVRKFRAGDGHHTWTDAEIARYFEVHHAGTLAHTAMTLMLYTGAARADAVRLGWGNVQTGQNVQFARISYRRQKMMTRAGVLVDIPVHPALAAVLDVLPRDAFTFLQTRGGTGRSPNAFGNLMREWCREAGLPECTSHGLRKAMARRLAEAGASPAEIGAVTGHKSMAEVAHYAQEAERSGLADSAMARLAAPKVVVMKRSE